MLRKTFLSNNENTLDYRDNDFNEIKIYDPRTIINYSNNEIISHETNFTMDLKLYIVSLNKIKAIKTNTLVLKLIDEQNCLEIYEYFNQNTDNFQPSQYSIHENETNQDKFHRHFFINSKIIDSKLFVLIKSINLIRREYYICSSISFNFTFDLLHKDYLIEQLSKDIGSKKIKFDQLNKEDEEKTNNDDEKDNNNDHPSKKICENSTHSSFIIYEQKQMIEGEDFDLIVLVQYGRRLSNLVPAQILQQNEINYGLIFLKREQTVGENSSIDNSKETLTMRFDSSLITQNPTCYGAGDSNPEAEPKFIFPIPHINVNSTKSICTSNFEEVEFNEEFPLTLNVAMFPINQCTDYDNIRSSHRGDIYRCIDADKCENMLFHLLVNMEEVRSFNEESNNNNGICCSNFTIPDFTPESILHFINLNKTMLISMISDLERTSRDEEDHDRVNFASTLVTINEVNFFHYFQPISFDIDSDIRYPIQNILSAETRPIKILKKYHLHVADITIDKYQSDTETEDNNVSTSGYCNMVQNTKVFKDNKGSKITIHIGEPKNTVHYDPAVTTCKCCKSKSIRNTYKRSSFKNVTDHSKHIRQQVARPFHRKNNSQPRPCTDENINSRRQCTKENINSNSSTNSFPNNNKPTIHDTIEGAAKANDIVFRRNDGRFQSVRVNNKIVPTRRTAYRAGEFSKGIDKFSSSNPINAFKPREYNKGKDRFSSFNSSNNSKNSKTNSSFNKSQKDNVNNLLNGGNGVSPKINSNSSISNSNTSSQVQPLNFQNYTLEEVLHQTQPRQERPNHAERLNIQSNQIIDLMNRNDIYIRKIMNLEKEIVNIKNQEASQNLINKKVNFNNNDNNNNNNNNNDGNCSMIKHCNSSISTQLALVDTGSTNSHLIIESPFDSINYSSTMSQTMANGSIIKTSGEGHVGKHKFCFTPNFSQNILSVHTLTEADDVVCFSKSKGAFTIKACDFDFNQTIDKKFQRINNLYYLNINELKETKVVTPYNPKPIKGLTYNAVGNSHPPGSIILWHQRLHLSNNYIKRLVQLNLVIGLQINDYDMKRQLAVCESCMYSKFTRNSFFKKFEAERRERYKVTRKELKEYRDQKSNKPFSTDYLKQNKFPDKPLSEFDHYDKEDIIIEEDNPEFVKVKYNPKQNNLFGDPYSFIAVDLKGPFNIKGFHGERYLMAFIDAKASMQAELYLLPNKLSKTTASKLEHFLETVVIPNRKAMDIHYQFSIFHSDNGSEFQNDYIKIC